MLLPKDVKFKVAARRRKELLPEPASSGSSTPRAEEARRRDSHSD
jgi:hypothetical protein